MSTITRAIGFAGRHVRTVRRKMVNATKIINAFHKFYYDSQVWQDTKWLGVNLHKYPSDLWVYQEIIYETQPDLIVECGTRYGGSALYLAHLCDLMGHGEVLTIDVENQGQPEHPRITYLLGSSVSESILSLVKEKAGKSVMVILDSDHTKEHVLKELYAYSQIVTPDQYLIVEDTNLNGHPVYKEFGDGPMEALTEFLTSNKTFTVDRSREKFLVTANPKGFLLKGHSPTRV